jgi:SAM-dependent methyltransferase
VAACRPAVIADEDRLPFADQSLAVLFGVMTLQGVNDLPGALILARRALKPGGHFLAVLPAGASGGELRMALLESDAASGRGVAPRIGPAVDPAQGAALPQRAGFIDPVADLETLHLRYATLADAARDIRAHGESGWLTARTRAMTGRHRWARAEAAFARSAGPDGRVAVRLDLLYLTGRSPPAGMSSRDYT